MPDLLARGEISLRGRLPRSSNATFLVELTLDGARGLAVYKPGRGERPLWDFPPNLYRREVAACRLAEALGWPVVPPTVERPGPLGPGSVQQFVHADFAQHYFTLREDPAHHERLRLICALDLLANNADRKSGHCLVDGEGRVWAVDNGLTFHPDPKLRTVIWDFAGQPLPAPVVTGMERLLAAGLPADLAGLLTADERRALLARARALLDAPRFPADPGHRYPWPLV